MIEPIKSSTGRNPYGTKLKRWEEEILEIETLINKLPEVNFLTLGVEVFNQLVSSQKSDFSEISTKLEKIRSGVKKMVDTLSCQDGTGGSSDAQSDAQLDDYSERMIDLLLKTNRLAKELSKKDPQKRLKSVMAD